MPAFFESHAHYYDARFSSEECPEGPLALLDRLFGEGLLCGAVNVGVDIASTRAAIAQARRYPAMYVAAGFHPTDAMGYPDREAALRELRALIADRDNKIVAIGEIGLDYHYPDTDRARQIAWFDAQLSLSEECGFPVIVHDREAHGDCFEAVCAHPKSHGVFHSYSGSAEMARDLIRRGYYISFSGTVTFRNAQKVAAVAAALPHDRVLIETDCPYLAPEPYRGRLNHSGYLIYTAARLAELWKTTPEEVAALTAENARRLFLHS